MPCSYNARNSRPAQKGCFIFILCFTLLIVEYVIGFNNIYVQVVRLLYTNSGVGLLALGSNAIQRLWKWSRNEQNPSGKVHITFCWFFWGFINQVCDIIFLSIQLSRPQLVLCHTIGSQTAVLSWQMIQQIPTQRRQFHALPSPRMILMWCLLVVGRFLCLTWWHLR